MIPVDIRYHQNSRQLELTYENGQPHRLSAEFLRVYSPSAEVRGHGEGQEVLQTGKRHVTISGLEPSGNYALKIHFSDGHNTGLYTWSYLFDLAQHQERLWQEYLDALERAGASRDPSPASVQTFNPA